MTADQPATRKIQSTEKVFSVETKTGVLSVTQHSRKQRSGWTRTGRRNVHHLKKQIRTTQRPCQQEERAKMTKQLFRQETFVKATEKLHQTEKEIRVAQLKEQEKGAQS